MTRPKVPREDDIVVETGNLIDRLRQHNDPLLDEAAGEIERLWAMEIQLMEVRNDFADARLRWAEQMAKKDEEIEAAKNAVDHAALYAARSRGYVNAAMSFTGIIANLLEAAQSNNTRGHDHGHEED